MALRNTALHRVECQPECILCTPALQSAINSGTPIRTPHSRLHLLKWQALVPGLHIFGVKIGLECGVDDGLECGVECSTPMRTTIHLVEWSADWSAAIRTPKIIADWSADCTPKFFCGLEWGLHSKKIRVPNTLLDDETSGFKMMVTNTKL